MKKPPVKFLIIGAILLILGFFTFNYLIFWIGKPGNKSVTVNSDQQTGLVLGDFRLIEGTNYFMAPIANERSSSFIEYSSARWYSYGASGQLRNIIFLDGQTLAPRKLYEANSSFLLSVAPFPEKKNSTINSTEDLITPVEWFVYFVVHEDSNNDELLNENDMGVLAISDYNGQRYKEMLNGITKLYELTMLEHGQLIVVYSLSNGRFASLVDMVSQTITLTADFPDLGPEVD